MERSPAAYAFQRYQKLGGAYEAPRELAYTAAKRIKNYSDMGAIQNEFNVGDNVRIRMAPLNRPATKLLWKWSMLCQILAGTGVVATVEEPKMEESFTVHVDRLAFTDVVWKYHVCHFCALEHGCNRAIRRSDIRDISIQRQFSCPRLRSELAPETFVPFDVPFRSFRILPRISCLAKAQ